FDVEALKAHAATNPPAPDDAAIAASLIGMLPGPESKRQAYMQEFTAFQQEMNGLEARLQAQFKQAEQEAVAAASAALGEGYGKPGPGLDDLPEGPRASLTRESLLDRVQAGASAAWTALEN